MPTDDEHREGYQKIKGRWWRSSDPHIPARLRQELVNELMSARRAVGCAKKACCEHELSAARFRVNNAKCALGERGYKWWMPDDDSELPMRVLSTFCALLHHRPEGSLCPSEVARIATGDQWRDKMNTVRELAQHLACQELVEITQKGERVQPPYSGPIRVRRGPQFSTLTRQSLQTIKAELE